MSSPHYNKEAAVGGDAWGSPGDADQRPKPPPSLQSSDRYSASTVKDNDATERSHRSPMSSPSPSGCDTQISSDQLSPTLQDFSLSRPLPPQLDEPDFELGVGKPELEGPEDGHLQIHRDAMRGGEFLSPISNPGLKKEPSVVSDLGNREYDTRHQVTSDAESSADDTDSRSDSLHDKLMDGLVRYQNTRKGFIPRGHFDRVVNEKSVRLELESCRRLRSRLSGLSSKARDRKIRYFVDRIFGKSFQKGKYKQIFGILVLAEKADYIVDFLDQTVDDSDLPFRGDQSASGPIKELYPRKGGPSIKLFKEWKPGRRESFVEWQWVIVAAFFFRGNGGEAKIFNLHDNATPPFVRNTKSGHKEIEEYEGGFGKVTKRYIHADHHDLKPDKNSAFAIKKINSRKYEHFKAEFDMLVKLGKTPNPHLISLLGAYCHRKSNYLIFDWADSDLSKYWRERNPKPEFNHDTVLWVVAQCAGLASGLQQIHRYGSILASNSPGSDRDLKLYGRHGDIKPENVLWFRKENRGGTLKIYDLETMAEIKPEVTRFIEKAHTNPKCSQLVHDLLDVIQTGLLVVETKDEKSPRRIERHCIRGRTMSQDVTWIS
ncbi:hypothetical protein CEP53_004787 [Fusarium sp. AF-6]|nr:hypothetical protein CEP53_004787 [Fusarium sp. AF-6]